jgi:diacylglycerol O-acyltransferase
MNKMSLFDMSFFIAETADSPKHVAGLIIFKRPEHSKASFVKDLHEELLTFTDVHAPFKPDGGVLVHRCAALERLCR